MAPQDSSGKLTIRIEPWGKVTKRDRAAIEDQAERLAAFRNVTITADTDQL